jgi:predicted dienelactone hydrolase
MKSLHCAALSLGLSLMAEAKFLLPQGTGPYQSALTISELVDDSRMDPFNSSHVRRLMISRFDPVPTNSCNLTTAPYFTPATAAAENDILASYDYPRIFEDFALQVCEQAGNSSTKSAFPIAIYSPGLNTSRLFGSSIAQELASHGFTTITIDHPYDVDVVEFPDGTVIYGGRVDKPTANSSASVEAALEVRAADVSFVLDSLALCDDADVVMFGQSFGGAAVATSMLRDPRIKAGVNVDGIMFGPVLTEGLGSSSPPRPFVLWGSDGHNTTEDKSWGQFWATMGSSGSVSYKKEFTILNSTHGSHWDLNILVDVAGIRDELSETAGWLIGPGPASRLWEIMGRYLSSYFLFSLGKETEGDILKGPSDEFPEVVILQ